MPPTTVPFTPNPDAVLYPHNFPYEHQPQLEHSCRCHKGEPIDHDAFAAMCALSYAEREDWEKQTRGARPRQRTMAPDDPFENFVRFNPALAWERLSGVYYSPESWEEGAREDKVVGSDRREFEDGTAVGGEGVLDALRGVVDSVFLRLKEGEKERKEGAGKGDESETEAEDEKTLTGDDGEWEMVA